MYGHAPFHSSTTETHKYHSCNLYDISHTGSTISLSVNFFFFAFFGVGYKQMTCCGVEIHVGNTGKQNTCQMSWHFCSQNTNLRWQYKKNPDTHLPFLQQPGCRQAAPPGWLLSLPFSPTLSLLLPLSWHSDSQLWLPEPGHCHAWPLSALTSYSSSRWPDGILWKIYSSFFCRKCCQKRLTKKNKWP